MKRDTLKYIGLGLIAVVLLAANINMVYKTFFAKNRLDPSYKQPAVVTDEQISRYADTLFTHTDSLIINDDGIMSNKRIIIENGDTLGFAFIVYEPIPCPSCSDVNYILFTDTRYSILKIIYFRDIIEDYKAIPKKTFLNETGDLIGMNVLRDSLTVSFSDKVPKKQSQAFTASILDLQSRVRLFNEY